MRTWIYALTILTCYGVIAWRGIDLLPASQHQLVPASARNSSGGGYRSYYRSSWGYHGGK